MKKFNFNFLTTLVIASVWLCVSCSHNKKTSTYSGLSEEATEASAEVAAPVEEAQQQAEAVPAEAPSEELAQVMAPEVAPQDSAVSEIMALSESAPVVAQAEPQAPTEVAEPEAVSPSPETLDGSEAGFLSSDSELLGQAPKAAEEAPIEAPVVAPVVEKAPQQKSTQPATRKVPRPAHPAAMHKRAEATVPSLEQKAREEQTAQTMREVLGNEEPAVAEAAKPQNDQGEKKEQLASAEVGTFFERHLFWVAVCLVAFFGFAFVSTKRGKNKDMPL